MKMHGGGYGTDPENNFKNEKIHDEGRYRRDHNNSPKHQKTLGGSQN
jgi:hypothetical protein